MADNLDVLIQEADISYRWLTIKESANTTQEGVSALAKNRQLATRCCLSMLSLVMLVVCPLFHRFLIAGGSQLLSTYTTALTISAHNFCILKEIVKKIHT